jgi:Spectrin repeat
LLAKLDGIEAEMQTHEPVYKRALADGVELAKNYPDNERYSRLCETVREKWAKLLELLPLRRQNLRLAEQGHQYWLDFADLNEWVEHNLHQMRGSPSAKDADATERLIAQNNQMGRDLGTEKELVEDLDKQAKALIQHGHPDAKNISSSQKALKQKMEELEEVRHCFLKESRNFLGQILI